MLCGTAPHVLPSLSRREAPAGRVCVVQAGSLDQLKKAAGVQRGNRLAPAAGTFTLPFPACLLITRRRRRVPPARPPTAPRGSAAPGRRRRPAPAALRCWAAALPAAAAATHLRCVARSCCRCPGCMALMPGRGKVVSRMATVGCCWISACSGLAPPPCPRTQRHPCSLQAPAGCSSSLGAPCTLLSHLCPAALGS